MGYIDRENVMFQYIISTYKATITAIGSAEEIEAKFAKYFGIMSLNCYY